MRARVRFSVACMGAYVRVFVSAFVRVSVARLHACVCTLCVRVSVACLHVCVCSLCVRVSVARLHACVSCVRACVRAG